MTKIGAALTAAQWQGVTLPSGEIVRSIEGAGATDESINVGDGFDAVAFSGRQRHALAALALYGQPFGFTEVDVMALLTISVRESVMRELSPIERQQLDAVALRIAALLPPSE